MSTTGKGALLVAGSPSDSVFEQVTPLRDQHSCSLPALPPVAQAASSTKRRNLMSVSPQRLAHRPRINPRRVPEMLIALAGFVAMVITEVTCLAIWDLHWWTPLAILAVGAPFCVAAVRVVLRDERRTRP